MRQQIVNQDEGNIVQSPVDILSIKSVRRLNEFSDVWCLTVPECGHFALGNGAIVKNCDAFQSLALTLKPEQAIKKTVVVSTNRSATLRPNANSWMEA